VVSSFWRTVRNEVSYLPLLKSWWSSTLRSQRTLVVMPRTTYSESARRSRSMAWSRFSAQTESLLIMGS
jgi:hypothetical protein